MTRNTTRLRWLWIALTCALPAAGCYETPRPECAFLCGSNGACPDGYSCASDGVCKRLDVPDNFACGFTAQPPDAPPADAPPPDAPPADAPPPDAPPADAPTPPDALPPPDATPDARPIPDAPPPDAAPRSPGER